MERVNRRIGLPGQSSSFLSSRESRLGSPVLDSLIPRALVAAPRSGWPAGTVAGGVEPGSPTEAAAEAACVAGSTGAFAAALAAGAGRVADYTCTGTPASSP